MLAMNVASNDRMLHFLLVMLIFMLKQADLTAVQNRTPNPVIGNANKLSNNLTFDIQQNGTAVVL